MEIKRKGKNDGGEKEGNNRKKKEKSEGTGDRIEKLY